MGLSRKNLLLAGAGAIVVGGVAASLPGGGPRSYLGGIEPEHHFKKEGSEFTPDELRAELDWLVNTMREVGARPFASSDEGEFNRRYQAARAALDRPMNAAALYLIAAPLFAALNDGHVSVGYGREFERWRYVHGGLLFPLFLVFKERGAFVGLSTDKRIPRRSRILSVDGIDIREIQNAIEAVTGGQSRSLQRVFLGSRLDEYFYATKGERKSYRVRFVGKDGVARSIICAAVTSETRDKELLSLIGDDPYVFSRLAGGTVGYMNYRRCDDLPRFQKFLATTFADVKAKPIRGLIIDIRSNGGGNSALNDDLWSYAQGKAFSQGGKMTVKVASRLKREYGFSKYSEIYTPIAWFAPDQTVMTLDVSAFNTVKPGKNPLRYNGPVYLLIGNGTFSSAELCAVAAKDYGLATIVGEETGEPANTTGEQYGGYSPRVGLSFGFTTKYYWAPKPHPDRQGVLPDVRIVPTEDDLRRGRDPVLDYAVKAILG